MLIQKSKNLSRTEAVERQSRLNKRREAFSVCAWGLRLPVWATDKCPPASYFILTAYNGEVVSHKLCIMSNYAYRLLSSFFQPDCEPMPCYVGKTKNDLINNYPDCHIVNESADSFDMEIRLKDATLTYAFHNDIRIDARLFRDNHKKCISLFVDFLLYRNWYLFDYAKDYRQSNVFCGKAERNCRS